MLCIKKIEKEYINEIIDNMGFFDAYDHIKKVMYGNMSSTNPRHEAITGLWAFKSLERIKNHILNISPYKRRFKKEMSKVMDDKISELRELHQVVRLKIIDNCKLSNDEDFNNNLKNDEPIDSIFEKEGLL